MKMFLRIATYMCALPAATCLALAIYAQKPGELEHGQSWLYLAIALVLCLLVLALCEVRLTLSERESRADD